MDPTLREQIDKIDEQLIKLKNTPLLFMCE